MFKNYLIVASKKDLAGINITTQLSQFGKFNFYLTEGDITKTEFLNLEKINQYDLIIFASKHSSKSKEKVITIHPNGYIDKGEFSMSSALFNKELFIRLHETAEKFGFKDFKITLEATHHGPIINKPAVFVEIGSGEQEWKNKRASFIVAKSILTAIKNFNPDEYTEVAIGIGGDHYCKNFNEMQLKSNVAISHIIPYYQFPVEKDKIEEAIKKTYEEVDYILIDKKNLGKKEQKEIIFEELKKIYLPQWSIGELKKRTDMNLPFETEN